MNSTVYEVKQINMYTKRQHQGTMNAMKIKRLIQRLRTEYRYSYRAIGEEIGLSHSSVYNLGTGQWKSTNDCVIEKLENLGRSENIEFYRLTDN